MGSGNVSIEFTKEELELLAKIVRTYPVQGNVQSLPYVLDVMVGILAKIQAGVDNVDK